jgi:predicted nucleic acid-binding protein
MILVDTSVWIEHFRHGNIGLDTPLNEGQVVSHPFIIGELACGNIKNRSYILSLLNRLPSAHRAEHEEVMHFIDRHHLRGKGLGYVDVHLLASAMLTNSSLWTFDKRLNSVSTKIGVKG